MSNDITTEESILETVRRLPRQLETFRELLLANLVMIGEIPAPSFGESARIDFLKQRFNESGLQNCSTDEIGNGLAILPGSEGKKSILLAAHADTPFESTVNHSLSLDTDRVVGPGVGDNSLGIAVLATLPTILERLNISFRDNLVLMGTVRSLGRGNLQGLRFFLNNNQLPLVAAISVEGSRLGRLHYTTVASLGGEITCSTVDDGWPTGAIDILQDVINGLRLIEIPTQNRTDLVLGQVKGGTSFEYPARSALVRFQVSSESDETVKHITEQIQELTERVATESGASVELELIARRKSGGLRADHPLVLQARRIMTSLGLQPLEGCCASVASSFHERGIPALTIGITNGLQVNQPGEQVAIQPMMQGIAQLIGILMAMDGGCCERH